MTSTKYFIFIPYLCIQTAAGAATFINMLTFDSLCSVDVSKSVEQRNNYTAYLSHFKYRIISWYFSRNQVFYREVTNCAVSKFKHGINNFKQCVINYM